MATHFANLNGIKGTDLVVLGLCLFISFTLRFYLFEQESLWLDEMHTFGDSGDGVVRRLRWQQEGPAYLDPPLFCPDSHLLSLSLGREAVPDFSSYLRNLIHTDLPFPFKVILPLYCSLLCVVVGLHDLSHQPFTKWGCYSPSFEGCFPHIHPRCEDARVSALEDQKQD